MALGNVKILIFQPFFFFETFLENYPAKSGFSSSIEIKGWVNLFCISGCLFKTKSYDSRNCQLSDLFTAFSTFLDNYPAKSDIIRLVDTAGCWKLVY